MLCRERLIAPRLENLFFEVVETPRARNSVVHVLLHLRVDREVGYLKSNQNKIKTSLKIKIRLIDKTEIKIKCMIKI